MAKEANEQEAQNQNTPEAPENTNTPQAGGETPETTKPADPDFSKMSADDLKEFAKTALDAKRAANAEAKGYRTKLEAKETADQDAADKKLAEEGKYKELYEKQQARNKRLAAENSLSNAVNSIGKVHNMDVVMKVADGKFEYDDDGNVTNTSAIVKDLQENHSYLFVKESTEQPVITKESTTTKSNAPQPGEGGNADKSIKEQKEEWYSTPHDERPRGRVQ